MQRARPAIMKSVKHTIHTIGDRSGDFARTVGSETVDLAKRFGSGTASLAKRIGPRRALIGLAALAAIGGSVMLVRYLRARKLESKRGLEDMTEDVSGKDVKSGNRAAQRFPNAHPSH
jgi:hypothetical protein